MQRYKIELNTNRDLFEKGKIYARDGSEHKVISKNKPPIAGSISWAKSIFHRIKRPILKFMTKEETLEKTLFNDIKNEYKSLAKTIDYYQREKFSEWENKITDKAMLFLRDKILER